MPTSDVIESKPYQTDKPLSWSEIERCGWDEIAQAKEFGQNFAPGRMESWDRYYGRPYGNEKKGRSKHITRDVMNDIEWMMPFFINKFCSNEQPLKIYIKGKPAWIGEALKKKIDEDLDEGFPTQFLLFYTWIKDALVSATSAVKLNWEFEEEQTEHSFRNPITLEQLHQIMTDDNLSLDTEPEPVSMPDGNLGFQGVSISGSKVVADRLGCDNLPHWELLFSEDSRGVNDNYGKGHKTTVRVDDLKRINRAKTTDPKKPYFRRLDELEDGAGPRTEGAGGYGAQTSAGSGEAEKLSYLNYIGRIGPDDQTKGPGRKVDLIEWYTRMDVDGDGYLEPVVLWYANDFLIRWEINEDIYPSISLLSPIIDCYKITGISWADLIKEIQNLHTAVIRASLDSFAFHIRGRWRVSPTGNVNVAHLLNNVPGDVIMGDENSIEDISPKQMDIRAPLAMVSIIEKMREERSGVTKLSQGHMSLNQATGTGTNQLGSTPDRGIARLLMEAQKRMDMVARVFAETGMRDFYLKAARLYQKYMDVPFEIEVGGRTVQITPEAIQGKVQIKINLAVEKSVGWSKAQLIQQIFTLMGQAGQMFPGLLDPEKAYQIMSQIISVQGFDPNEFLPEFPRFMQRTEQSQKQQAQQASLAQQLQQVQAKLEQMDRQLEARKIALDHQTDIRKLEQKNTDSKRDFIVDLIELIIKGESEEAQRLLDATKLRNESNDRKSQSSSTSA